MGTNHQMSDWGCAYLNECFGKEKRGTLIVVIMNRNKQVNKFYFLYILPGLDKTQTGTFNPNNDNNCPRCSYQHPPKRFHDLNSKQK